MDGLDRTIINNLQGGFPVTETPFRDAADTLETDEATLIGRIGDMVERGDISRFGPLYDAEAMGGAVTLAAMAVPEEDFDATAELVNGYKEVAHNYERDHRLNMWFVVSAESRKEIDAVLADIERRTGIEVCDMPKEQEFFIGLKLEA